MSVYHNLTDDELMPLLKSGDNIAFAEIFERYWDLLYLHCIRMIRDEDDAKDIVQELFTNLWLKAGQITFNTSLSAYLYTSVRNRIINQIEHKRVRTDYIGSLRDFMNGGEVIVNESDRDNELVALIEKEISLLPPKMREIFELSHKEHYSYREIAEKLNISDKTVKKQVSNALKIIRLRLNVSIATLFIILYY